MNSNEIRQFFDSILTAIDYQDDKQSFTNKFLKNISLEVLSELIGTKTGTERQVLIEEVSKVYTLEDYDAMLARNFDSQVVEDKYREVTKNLFEEYLNFIDKSLTSKQRENLKTVLKSVKAEA